MEALKQYTVSEITVVYTPVKAAERPVITTAHDAHVHLLEGYKQSTIGLQEQFVVMYLNQSNRILAMYHASTGSITSVIADIRLVLSVALKVAATSMIISHNHPSGSLKPSRQDEELTRKLQEAAKVMDLKLLDHIIVEPTGERYFSFADEGLL